MTTTWYSVNTAGYYTSRDDIKEFIVEKETKEFIFFPSGQSVKKDGKTRKYFPAKEQAANYLKGVMSAKINAYIAAANGIKSDLKLLESDFPSV